jgi:phage terminase large subunit-like protein
MPTLTKTKLERYRAYADAHPEDKQFARGLAALAEQTQDNPLLLAGPLPGFAEQEQFLEAWEPFICFSAGNRSGKSHSGMLKMLIECLSYDELPPHLHRFKHFDHPIRARIGSPGQTSTTEVVLFDKLRQLCPNFVLRGGLFTSAYDKQSRILHFECGSWIQFCSYEQDLDKWKGAELEAIWLDEEAPGQKGHEIWIECCARVVTTNGRIWLTQTPSALDITWSAWEVYDKESDPDFRIIYADIEQNTTVSAAERERFLSRLSSEELASRKSGKPPHFQGRIYHEFDYARHVVDPIAPKDLKGYREIIVGIDPGLRTTACVWGAFDRDENILIFDELYLHDQHIDAVCKQIHARNAHWGISEPDYYVIDPSFASGTQFVNAENIQAEFERFGINCSPGYNAVEAGILQVKRRLTHDALKITRNCEKLLWETNRYHYERKEDGTFKVAKKDDHALDAERYLCAFHTWGPEMAVKRESNYVRWHYGESFDGVPQQPEMEMV